MREPPKVVSTNPIRDPGEFYRKVETASGANERLRFFIAVYSTHRELVGRELNVLDVGSGRKPVLADHMNQGDTYVATDVAAPDDGTYPGRFEVLDLNRESLAGRLAGETFDVIFCGEVIEHLFSPDALLVDLYTLLADDGVLLLSTPNLGYWVNRILLLVGISPLFLENSSQTKLGRRFRLLGQGHSTEGHIRLFTYRALKELADLHDFRVVKIKAVPVWRTLIDTWVCRLAPSLSPDLILVLAKKPEA